MKVSTILSFPLMAGCILLAFLIRNPVSAIFVDDGSDELMMVTTGWRLWMANWRSNGPLVVAGLLFLRFVIEAVRMWLGSCRIRRGHGKPTPVESAVREDRKRNEYDLRMFMMAGTPFLALLILGTGYMMSNGMELVLAFTALAACVATVGMVAAGSVVATKRSIGDKVLASLFLMLNAAPVSFSIFLIAPATLEIPWR